MSDIIVDVTELLEIGRNGNESIENLKNEILNFKNIAAEIEALESPKYLEDLLESLNDFADTADEEVLANIEEFYSRLADIAEVFEDFDATLMKEK